MPEYTVVAALAIVAVVVLEVVVLRTGLFRTRSYWVNMAITLFFMILFQAWLTKLSAPVFLYDRDMISGIRFPFDIPIEDYGMGFALVTFTLLLWERDEASETPGTLEQR